MRFEDEDLNDREEKALNEKKEFQEKFDELDSRTKGRWAEIATIKEADAADQVVLVDHPENPNKPGFDCVSIDPETSRLHVWEAKNFGEYTHLEVSDLTAWKDVENGKFREGFLHNVREVIDSVPDGDVRNIVRKSIAEGNVTYHLRVGPETNVSSNLESKIRDYLPPDADFDIKRYSHEYMNRLDNVIDAEDISEQQDAQPETVKNDEKVGGMEWRERGIQDVPLEKIDTTDTYVENASDFHKVSRDEMIMGFDKLENEVRPAVKEGANGDDFSELDKKLGLDYEHGYRRIYDAFYGSEPVRLLKDGDRYTVDTGGYHRIYIAQELGLPSIPASVLERIRR